MDLLIKMMMTKICSFTSQHLQQANISGLNEGDKISYDVEEENGKASAVNIKQIYNSLK